MHGITDVLELLTAQHDELDWHVAQLAGERDLTARATALGALADRLTTHLAAKQEVFYPALSTVVSRDIMSEVLSEHREIRRVLGDLVWLDVDDPVFDQKLATLTLLLLGHTEWQEGELFVTAAETLPAAELSALGGALTSWVERTEKFELAFAA